VRRSLELAAERGCRTLAIPAIGAGIGGLSVQRCAEILLEEARTHLAAETPLEEIRFVLFGEPVYRIFESTRDAAKIREQMDRLRGRK
jgi:O-acetyl-ADP-ribose deacetylase (regulator of RNase III)